MLVPKAPFDLFERSSFNNKPGTVGLVAVPPKSPVSLTIPLVDDDASAAPAETCASTYAVVASFVELSPSVGVGAVGVPVNTGDAMFALFAKSAANAVPSVA